MSPFVSRHSIVVGLLAVALVSLVLLANPEFFNETNNNKTFVQVLNNNNVKIGIIELFPLQSDGSLKLAFAPNPQLQNDKIEWWQLAEREDLSGYPRIDPQSGGSGLPGARGEDEDPAYYTEADFLNPDLAPRIFHEGRVWLLDRPTFDSGFRFESWIVERRGPKKATLLAGVRWGVSVKNGEIEGLHHPEPIRRGTKFDIHESLRISGFGGGWDIGFANRPRLP